MYLYFSSLAVDDVIKLRIWLKNELYKLGNETWKGEIEFQCQKTVFPKQV